MLGARRHAGGLQPADARGAEARDEGGILAIGANADIGAVAIRQDVEHRREIHVHAEPSQLAAFEESLAMDEVDLPRCARGEIVGEDRDLAAKHDDAPALMVGGDQESPAERILEARKQACQTLRCLEVSPVQHDPGGLRLAEEPDVGLGEIGSGQPEHEATADESLERHGITGTAGRADARARSARGRVATNLEGVPAARRARWTAASTGLHPGDRWAASAARTRTGAVASGTAAATAGAPRR